MFQRLSLWRRQCTKGAGSDDEHGRCDRGRDGFLLHSISPGKAQPESLDAGSVHFDAQAAACPVSGGRLCRFAEISYLCRLSGPCNTPQPCLVGATLGTTLAPLLVSGAIPRERREHSAIHGVRDDQRRSHR